MKRLRSAFWHIAAILFGKPRFGKLILSKKPTLKFLVINCLNFLTFKMRSSRSFVPSTVLVEPASVCNFKCPHCPRQEQHTEREAPMMTLEFYRDFLRRNSWHLTHVSFGMFGEPLTNRDLPEMIRLNSHAGIKSLVITNGSPLTDELMCRLGKAGLTTLCFSIDSLWEEYEKHRGRPFDEVLEKLRIATHHKQDFSYSIEICSLADTGKYDPEEVKTFFESLDENIDLVNFQPYFFDESNREIPFDRPCYRLWHLVGVYSDALVTACCFDNERSLVIGNARTQSLAEIFNGSHMMAFRNQFLEDNPPDMCRKCNPYYR